MSWESVKDIAVVLSLFLPLLGFSLALIGTPPDFQVDAEYINGILTASSIVFGFWVVVLERRPEEKVEKWLYKYATGKVILLNILFLSCRFSWFS